MERKMPQWFAFAAVLAVLMLISACQPESTPTQAKNLTTFRGTVKTGADLGEVKQFCPEGLYLVAEDGFLKDQTTMLLMKVLDDSGQATMLSDPQYIGEQVEVLGKYPAQEVFCEALICQCEDYILVRHIELR